MDDLQYSCKLVKAEYQPVEVLNLVINGWPSIPDST